MTYSRFLSQFQELCFTNEDDIIMDECSIVQYRRSRIATTGVATCQKLTVLDFLERVHPTSGRLNPICREICSNCQKSSSQMKRCSRCRESFYCCAQCQRDDWPVHKLTCGKQSAPLNIRVQNLFSSTIQKKCFEVLQ